MKNFFITIIDLLFFSFFNPGLGSKSQKKPRTGSPVIAKLSFATSLMIITLFIPVSCTKSGNDSDYISIKSISFIEPDKNIWLRDSRESISKSYPEYREKDYKIIPIYSYTAEQNKGVIIISSISSMSSLSSTLQESKKSFLSRKKSGIKMIEESYANNNLLFSHFLLDSNITFSRIYISNKNPEPSDVLIVDFICSPDQYEFLSESFKKFILSFKS